MSKLALNMIVKDDTEATLLFRCLSSIAPHVDGIFITITNNPSDKIKAVIENFGGTVSYYKWDKSFERARNYALTQVPEEYKYTVWTDSDDVWDNAEKLKDIVKIMDEQKITATFLDYNYQISPTGEVEIVHPRERIVRRDLYKWKGHLHETLIPIAQSHTSFYKNIKVNHYPPESAGEVNMVRNLEILEEMYKNEGKEHDPRTEYYLARQYFDMVRDEEADKIFNDYLEHSGWPEEKAMAWNYKGLIAVRKGDFIEARRRLLQAVDQYPNFPTWYVNLAYVACALENWDEAVHFSRMFANTPKPSNGASVYLPKDDLVRYHEVLYNIAKAKRKIPEAIDALKGLIAMVPDNKSLKEELENVERLNELTEVTKGVELIVKELEKENELDKAPILLTGLPSIVAENAYVEFLKQKYLPPKTWSDKSIVYWAGKSFEEWTPDSLKTGLGGSETAIVHLAQEWKKRGYEVTVYGNCGAREGEYDGVAYLNYYRFNRRDVFNTLVIWRAPWELDFKFEAKNVWLDLHDVPEAPEFTKERLANVSKIFVKSYYHRNLLPDVPDDKFVIITNGVDIKHEKLDHDKHNNHKLVYASSYDRGLELMLKWGWPIIKKEVPDATLDIYYGWNLFDTIHKGNAAQMAWKEKVVELMGQKGVKEHGRVGHYELLDIKARSAIHYYATNFEEIDCISVRESALVGCIPFTTDYAALEGRGYCVTTEGDPNEQETQEAVAYKIVEHLKDPDLLKDIRIKFKALAKEESWENVANKWLENL